MNWQEKASINILTLGSNLFLLQDARIHIWINVSYKLFIKIGFVRR